MTVTAYIASLLVAALVLAGLGVVRRNRALLGWAALSAAAALTLPGLVWLALR